MPYAFVCVREKWYKSRPELCTFTEISMHKLCFALKKFRDKKENERNFVSLNWIQIVLLDSIVCVINSLPFPLPPQQSQVDKQFHITGVSFKNNWIFVCIYSEPIIWCES